MSAPRTAIRSGSYVTADRGRSEWSASAHTAGRQSLDMSGSDPDHVADQSTEIVERFAPLEPSQESLFS